MITPACLTSQHEIDALEKALDNAIAQRYKENPSGSFIINLKSINAFTFAAWHVLKPRYKQHWDVTDESSTTVRPRIVFSMPPNIDWGDK